MYNYEDIAATQMAAIAKEEATKRPLADIVSDIGSKVAAMVAKNGNKDEYEEILEQELGNREFRAQEATEKQREQLEQILVALTERGY